MAGFFNRLAKAFGAFAGSPLQEEMDIQKGEASREMKAQVEDPLGVLTAMGYKEKPYSLSYDILRQMASRNSVVAAIIATRVNQISTFTSPARFNKQGLGFEIRLRDPNTAPSKQDMATIEAIEKFIENTGYTNDNNRDNFDAFVRKIVRDRLTFDQVNFEIVPDKKGLPAEFYAVDASTIRIASEELQEATEISDDEYIRYVQIVNGKVVAEFTANEMAFEVSNPRTDIYANGYGFSELETLVHIITSHLWAEQYNSKFFSQGGTTKGILNLKGSANAPISPQQLHDFKRQWLSQVSGMTGAWKTPVVSVEDIEYINVSQSNREMEFEKWMNYLINIACAVYQIDPAEVNFPNRGGAGNSGGGGLGDGGIEDRLKNSKDKGLKPMLRFIEAFMNKHIVSRFDEKFVFAFAGLDTKTEKEVVELQAQRVKVYKTVNEIRKEEGLKPLEGGDIILDTVYVQYLGQMQQQKMAEQQGAQGLGEDEDGNKPQGGFGNPEEEDDDDGYDWEEEDEEDGQDDSEEKDTKKSLDEAFEEFMKKSEEVKFLTIELED
ncbi:portal protein [Bacillus phage YungSlug]|nr:portal protein [Bacillus phage YungSlug]